MFNRILTDLCLLGMSVGSLGLVCVMALLIKNGCTVTVTEGYDEKAHISVRRANTGV